MDQVQEGVGIWYVLLPDLLLPSWARFIPLTAPVCPLHHVQPVPCLLQTLNCSPPPMGLHRSISTSRKESLVECATRALCAAALQNTGLHQPKSTLIHNAQKSLYKYGSYMRYMNISQCLDSGLLFTFFLHKSLQEEGIFFL